MAPGLVGDAVIQYGTVGDLFERIRISMPQDGPGRLSRQTYADILAHILAANQFPAGKTDLVPNADILKQITLDAQKPQGQPAAAGGSAAPAQAAAPAASGLDTAGIEKAVGRAGQVQADGAYRINLPRTDLAVTVDGLRIRPGLALGSWMAFNTSLGQAAVDGDLVLTETEINPVISKLQEEGLQITALHNHLINETPAVMYLHYFGRGDAVKLAQSMKAALSLTKTPLAPPAAAPAPGDDGGLDADKIQQILGRKGAVNAGVLGISVPRPEKISMMGVDLMPSMGMATAMNFQASGPGTIAATGDFVMVGDEVTPVATVLRANGIAITALHSHLVHGSPDLYFMHFWANGSTDKVAGGLKAALDLIGKK